MGVSSRVHRYTDPSGIWMGHVTTPVKHSACRLGCWFPANACQLAKKQNKSGIMSNPSGHRR